MKGVMIPSVSAGSNQREANVMWTPHVMVPSGAAVADRTAPKNVVNARSATTTREMNGLMVPPTGVRSCKTTMGSARAYHLAYKLSLRYRRRSGEGQRLDGELAAGEALQGEGRDVHGGRPAVQDHLRHELTGDRTVHEAVAAEPRDHVQARHAGRRAQDARLVRSHLIEAGPTLQQRRVGEGRHAVHRTLDERRGQTPVHVGTERAGLLLAPDAQQQPYPFAPHRDSLMRVDDERGSLGNPIEREGSGDELGPSKRGDGDLHAGELAHGRGPRAGGNHHDRCLDPGIARDHARHAARRALDPHDIVAGTDLYP